MGTPEYINTIIHYKWEKGRKEERYRQRGEEDRELGEREKKSGKEEDYNIVAMECMASINNIMARYR